MSLTVRENDVDVEAIKARVNPQDAMEAAAYIEDAEKLLAGLRKPEDGSHVHEVLRALRIAREALEEALSDTE